ncbi:MAG: hypothetical protein AAFZ87_07785, partial [Planctomycetota bacterium]
PASCARALGQSAGGAPRLPGGALRAVLAPPERLDLLAAAGFPAHFGAALAVGRAGVFVGAPSADFAGNATGLVYRFTDGNAGWRRAGAALQDPNGAPGERFGASVATFGRWVAVGAPRAASASGGRVLVFDVSGPVPLLDAVLHGATNPAGAIGGADRFGSALALGPCSAASTSQGPGLAVGAPGATWGGVDGAGRVDLFVRTAGRWRHTASVGSDLPTVGQAFGHTLARVGGTTVVGAPGDGRSAPGAGRVFGFGPDGATRFELGPPGGLAPSGVSPAGARFGSAVASLGPDQLAAGIPGRGAIATYTLDPSGRPGPARIAAGPPGLGFGLAVAGHPTCLAAGVPWASSPSVSLFAPVVGGPWTAAGIADTGGRVGPASEYGIVVAARGGVLAVGAPGSGADPGESPVPAVSAGRVFVHWIGDER